MKKKNVLVLLLVFLALLTPSCILFAQALSTSPFPEREDLSEVEMRLDASGGEKANGVNPIVRDADSREVDLLYAILAGAKRVPRRTLPGKKEYAAYRLTFRGEGADEEMTLYVGASDFSLYVLTSGKKLYRLQMPSVFLRKKELPPTSATFLYNGEEVVSNYDYPESPNGQVGITEISISRWSFLNEFDFSGENVSVSYRLYHKRYPENELFAETRNVNEIIEKNPDILMMDVTADLPEGITVTLHYYLSVQK